MRCSPGLSLPIHRSPITAPRRETGLSKGMQLTLNDTNATKRGTAVVVTALTPRIASCFDDPALASIGSCTVIGHLLRRLGAGMAQWCDEFVVLTTDSGIALPSIERESSGTRFGVFLSTRASLLGCLAEYVESAPEVGSLLTFPELAAFPDLVTAEDMLLFHQKSQADATTPVRTPGGFLPVIYRAEALLRLAAMELSEEYEGDILRLMAVSNQLDGAEAGYGFVVARYDPAQRRGIERRLLPASCLVGDEHSREAAARVLGEVGSGWPADCRAAQAYKRALLDIGDRVMARPEPTPARLSQYRPLHILFASVARGYSGAEASWLELIKNLDREQFVATVILPAASVASEALMEAGVVVELTRWNFAESALRSYSYWSDLLTRRTADVVDINGSAGIPLLACARHLGIPVVTHARAYDLVAIGNELQFSDLIVAVSNDVRLDVLRNDIREHRVVTVYNGVDLDRFRPGSPPAAEARRRLGLPIDGPLLTIVSRIAPEKRYEMLLEIVARLKPEFPSLVALCAGEAHYGQEAYFSALKRRADTLGISSHLRWLGFCRNLEDVFAASSLLVCCNPSEPLPRCAIEAGAMGLPTAGPRSGGMGEIIEDGLNGLLFAPNDVEDACSVVRRYLADPVLQQKLRIGARVAAQRFSIAEHVERMSQVFRSVANAG